MSEIPSDEIERIFQGAPIGLCVFDRALRWTHVNSRLAEMNGFPAAAHIGKRLGHEVRVASDGASGISLATTFRPEVIICDIGLPDMSGYDVARSIRSMPDLQGVLLIGLTGYALPEDRMRAAEAGFDMHLAKPASAERLRRAVAGEAEPVASTS